MRQAAKGQVKVSVCNVHVTAGKACIYPTYNVRCVMAQNKIDALSGKQEIEEQIRQPNAVIVPCGYC